MFHFKIDVWNSDIMKNISDLISVDRVKILDAGDKETALRQLSGLFASAESVGNIKELETAIFTRENLLSTGIGLGIAIPHVRLRSVTEMTIAIGICRKAIEYDSFDGQPVNIIIMIASPEGTHKEYLSILAKIVLLFKNSDVRNKILKAEAAEDIYSALKGL